MIDLTARDITLQDIADRCKVSKATVSRALRHDVRNISEEMIERICAVASKMGYDPTRHHDARRLAMRRSGSRVLNHLIALIFPTNFYELPYFFKMFKGVMDVLASEGFGLVTAYTDNQSINNMLPIFNRGDVDGIISISFSNGFSSTLSFLRAHANLGTRPVVTLLEPDENASAIMTDDFAGGHLAMSHLLDCGHRAILYFDNPRNPLPQRQRIAGFEQACYNCGLDPTAHLLKTAWDFDNLSLSEQRLLALLRAHPSITAIVAPNDPSAIRIAECLKREQYAIPADMSIIGYDDTDPLLDDRGNNILTTVSLPLVEVGSEAAKLVLRKLQDPDLGDLRIMLPTSLVVRGSTAPPAR